MIIISKTKYDEIYDSCILDCPSADLICVATCARDFQQNIEVCPCQSGCPNGCPCENYTCGSGKILILRGIEKPVLTNTGGLVDYNFIFGGTNSWHGCSLTWRDEHFIFGGGSSLFKIVGCELKRIGSLPFVHDFRFFFFNI